MKKKLLSIDATTIELCASVFNWAKFRRAKGAIELSLMVELDGLLPCYEVVTDGKLQDVTVVHKCSSHPWTILAFDLVRTSSVSTS